MEDNSDNNDVIAESYEILELENDLEVSRQTSLVECKKNPGHAGFIPVTALTPDHLPPDYQDPELFDCVKTLADLTVLVTTGHVGQARRQHCKAGANLYPQGNKLVSWRYGSGWLGNVVKYTPKESKANRTCPCDKCLMSANPSKEWGEIELYASTHVVFDDEEARDTVVRLFYDDDALGGGGCDNDASDTIGGWKMWWSNIEEDTCKMLCQTCDVALLDRLRPIVDRHSSLRYEVFEKYKGRPDRIAIIVSHPHGCPKRVSVGNWTLRKEVKPDGHNMETLYEYTTCTCPGSSGGPVLIIGDLEKMPFGHRHCGVNANKKNYSAAAWD